MAPLPLFVPAVVVAVVVAVTVVVAAVAAIVAVAEVRDKVGMPARVQRSYLGGLSSSTGALNLMAMILAAVGATRHQEQCGLSPAHVGTRRPSVATEGRMPGFSWHRHLAQRTFELPEENRSLGVIFCGAVVGIFCVTFQGHTQTSPCFAPVVSCCQSARAAYLTVFGSHRPLTINQQSRD